MRRAFLLTVLWSLLAVAPATAGPLVFDFEDGLQGWELHGSAQRVQTQVLGGQWAIFGDGVLVASVDLLTDPIAIRSVSVEMVLVDGAADALLLRTAGIGFARLDPFQVVQPGSPILLSVELDGAVPIQEFSIRWRGLPLMGPLPEVVAFIDNVTFHPIPEPGHLGLLGITGVMVLAARRRRSQSLHSSSRSSPVCDASSS